MLSKASLESNAESILMAWPGLTEVSEATGPFPEGGRPWSLSLREAMEPYPEGGRPWSLSLSKDTQPFLQPGHALGLGPCSTCSAGRGQQCPGWDTQPVLWSCSVSQPSPSWTRSNKHHTSSYSLTKLQHMCYRSSQFWLRIMKYESFQLLSVLNAY